MKACFSFALVLGLAACGGDDGDNTPADAAAPDSGGGGAVMVTCPATPAATVTTLNGDRFDPMSTTITQGQVVKFTMAAAHDLAPLDASSDPNLRVGFGKEACFMFTQTGTFRFKCTPHGFTGSITVN